MATSFFGGNFYGGEFFNSSGPTPPPVDVVKTGVGGIDKGDGLRRRIVKPTGFIERPKAKDPAVQERLDESASMQAEIAQRLFREFSEETVALQKPVIQMSQAEIDFEIGILLRRKVRTEEEELLLLLMMAASTV